MPFISSIRGNYSALGRGQKAEPAGIAKSVITGGTITTSGGYRIHTFTSVGASTLALNGYALPLSVEYLVVAGGAAGGAFNQGPGYNSAGAGGGAGGYRTGPLTISAPTSVTVGSGGPKGPRTVGGSSNPYTEPATTGNSSRNGTPSIFGPITSTGGGRGGAGSSQAGSWGYPAEPGGSGGGGVRDAYTSAGTGNSPSTSPPQGNPGGSYGGPDGPGGGGGGSGGAGATTPSVGGAGTPNSISGSAVTYTSGGGGGNGFVPNPGSRPPGGSPFGGVGGLKTESLPTGTGGDASGYGHGGGGAGSSANDGSPYKAGGNGSQGIVIVRYPFP